MGDDVIEWLAEIETEAAPGPWRVAHHGTVEVEDRHGSLVADFGTIACEGDARLIAALRSVAPELLAVVRAVEAQSQCPLCHMWTGPMRTPHGRPMTPRPHASGCEIGALRARLAEVRGG